MSFGTDVVRWVTFDACANRRGPRVNHHDAVPARLGLGAVVPGFDVGDQVEQRVGVLVDDASFAPDGVRRLADVVHGYVDTANGRGR